MAIVDVVDSTKRTVGSIDLNDGVFGASIKEPLVHSVVVMQRASLRQGTASTKGRGEVSGTGKKPWKQKGSGRARAGSNRSPIWRHGGTVFGPRPRGYDFSIPKKMYRGAMQSTGNATSAVEHAERHEHHGELRSAAECCEVLRSAAECAEYMGIRGTRRAPGASGDA